jgi:hypothetical protein
LTGQIKPAALPPRRVNVGFRLAQNAGETVFEVDGVFDGEAAAKLCALLAEAPPSTLRSVVLDFSRAREVTYIALAALLDEKRREARSVRIRGLASRQRRVLRFLAPEEASDGRT